MKLLWEVVVLLMDSCYYQVISQSLDWFSEVMFRCLFEQVFEVSDKEVLEEAQRQGLASSDCLKQG